MDPSRITSTTDVSHLFEPFSASLNNHLITPFSSSTSNGSYWTAETLPTEILYLIFTKLSITGLCHASQVCKTWLYIGRDEGHWKTRFDRLWTISDFETTQRKYRKLLTPEERASTTWRERYGVLYKCTFIWRSPLTPYEDIQMTTALTHIKDDIPRRQSKLIKGPSASTRIASCLQNNNQQVNQPVTPTSPNNSMSTLNQGIIESLEETEEEVTLALIRHEEIRTNKLNEEEELQLALELSLCFH
eukprot:TRINITY_DN14499_c0_g1_i1.p1 TRINITY_DN14499_c0_g1~~TRINITY_DN14499_c0_g1_i1.p1  ORF type:complete len:246 (+),score=36.39 TRINITY_DN14499_c0_g1_i1:21-758(+)